MTESHDFTSPLPASYWIGLRQLAEPFELMKFTLIYDGDLPSSGNKCQPVPASVIRNAFHDQLADLWDSHVIFRQLAHTARTKRGGLAFGSGEFRPAELPDFKGKNPRPLEDGQVDLVAPIQVPNVGSFIPIIRNSMYLACSVDVLFLRHEEPMTLLKHGGDLDGRLATLFDALQMPNPKHQYVGIPPTDDPLYVVLEDDALISDVSIKTGRLLGDKAKKPHTVRLTIDVTVKVLRVMDQNQCLIGG